MRLRRSSATDPTAANGQSIRATFGGAITNGQLAVGNANVQTQTVTPAPATDAELAELRAMFEALKARVAADAPPERREAAFERVEELERATFAEQPDLTTIQYVGKWFADNLPRLAGAVAGVVVHPIVGKLVGAAGDAIVAELRGT